MFREETNKKRIGTIIHGALGDCYEQLCAIRKLRQRDQTNSWVGFFAVKERLDAMRHFKLDMLDEIHLAEEISVINVDYFYQFQVKDCELKSEVIDVLPDSIKSKFDLKHNKKPWSFIRLHDFRHSVLELELSDAGKDYLPICFKENGIDPAIFGRDLTIGYLWRYRSSGGAYFQHPKDWIMRTKSELFRRLIDEHGARILICGMNKDAGTNEAIPEDILTRAGFVKGEYMSKFAEARLDLPQDRCTYLKGIGYAAEMEIMSRCDLLLMMPSGFSEALWMKQKAPVVLIDPPPDYMLRLAWNRMPLFNNNNPRYFYHNNFVKHSERNVIKFLKQRKLLP